MSFHQKEKSRECSDYGQSAGQQRNTPVRVLETEWSVPTSGMGEAQQDDFTWSGSAPKLLSAGAQNVTFCEKAVFEILINLGRTG